MCNMCIINFKLSLKYGNLLTKNMVLSQSFKWDVSIKSLPLELGEPYE